MAETLTDPMAGYDDRATLDVKMADGSTRYGGKLSTSGDYEFDPQREITPLAGRFFADVEANPNLSREAKLRVQAGYLTGIEEVREQRSKIENERMRSIMDRQTIEIREQSLAEARRRQEDATRSAERQKTIAEQAKGIIGSNLTPDEQRRQLGALQIEHLAEAATDPTVRSIFDTAAGVLPPPPEPFLSRTDVKSLILDKNVPAEIAALSQNNPELARVWIEQEEIRLKRESQNDADIKEGRERHTAMVEKLSDFTPEFISVDDLPNSVSKNDPNRLKYLTPETQNRGRKLMIAAYGEEGLKKYETLSDAERMDAIKDAQIELLKRDFRIRATPEKEAAVDNLVNSLVP